MHIVQAHAPVSGLPTMHTQDVSGPRAEQGHQKTENFVFDNLLQNVSIYIIWGRKLLYFSIHSGYLVVEWYISD